MAETTVTFLGTDSVTPTAGEDTASYLVNRTILVDTGWAAALRMMDHGVTPLDLDFLLFTHMHHDHYVGLPQLLFYRWMKERDREDKRPLTIVGPEADLELVLNLAIELLQPARFDYRPRVEVRPLTPGDTFDGPGFTLRTIPSQHPVQGLCYRFEDHASGAAVCFSGDTAYLPPLAELAQGADLLIHEASHGPEETRTKPNQWGHSGAPDAAQIAKDAQVKRLAIVHGPRNSRDAALAAAQAIFPDTFWPEPGSTLSLGG